MNTGDQNWLAPLVAFLIPAIGLLIREIHYRRKAKRQAASDASKTLSDKKKLLGDMISKTEDANSKQTLTNQLDEVNAALLRLYTTRLQHTLKEAGLPTEEMLTADGRSQLQTQEVTNLREIIEEVEALPPLVSIRDLLILGNTYYYMQQYEDAKNAYDKAISLEPNNPTTLNNRGNTYLKLGKYDEALADHNRSLELKPDDPTTLTNRGVTYAKLGKYDEALANHNRSLELKPDHPCTLFNLACLFSLKGKTDKALAHLKAAIDKDEKYREMAKTDKDFDNIREDPRFKKLTE